MQFKFDRLSNIHSRVIFNNINPSDVYYFENEQARQIINELGNLSQFSDNRSVDPSTIIKGFKTKKNLFSFCNVTSNIWMPTMESLDYSNFGQLLTSRVRSLFNSQVTRWKLE